MLIQFLVENFLSFKDETVFSMLAPPEETRGVVEVPAHGLRVMRIAAFYGANASGKSNLVKALEIAQEIIAHEQPAKGTLPAHYFRLEANASLRPSRFQFDFIIAGTRYSYVLIFSETAIVAEALYRRLPNIVEEEVMYEREAPLSGEEHRVTFGAIFDTDSDDLQFAEFTARGAHVRQPLLSKFAIGNVRGFAPIHRWFDTDLKLIGADAAYQDLIPELYRSGTMRQFYSEMLTKMGTGIRLVEVNKRTYYEFAKAWQNLQNIRGNRTKFKQIESVLLGPSTMNTSAAIAMDGDETSVLELKLMHANRAGLEVRFSLDDESDGTQRLLHLLPVLFHRTRQAGQCTVIDELDRSLHTTLTRYFVQEFLNMASDTQTQLIFTTHDTNLLNGRLLPPRAVWFVEKDDDGASRIYSLSEYKPEQLEQLLEHLEEGYLQGRFGAIPFIADRKNLAWQSDAEKPTI